MMKRWLIAYWPYFCSTPASKIVETDNIEAAIKEVTAEERGAVIFFGELPEKIIWREQLMGELKK